MRGAALQVPYHWKFMPLAAVDEAGVQNTWYTVLDTTTNVRLYSFVGNQVNNEAAAKDIAIRVTIDGLTLSYAVSSSSGGLRYFIMQPTTEAYYHGNVYTLVGTYVALHGRSVKVEIRSTSAAGTNQHLYGYVRYAVLGVAPS